MLHGVRVAEGGVAHQLRHLVRVASGGVKGAAGEAFISGDSESERERESARGGRVGTGGVKRRVEGGRERKGSSRRMFTLVLLCGDKEEPSICAAPYRAAGY